MPDFQKSLTCRSLIKTNESHFLKKHKNTDRNGVTGHGPKYQNTQLKT